MPKNDVGRGHWRPDWSPPFVTLISLVHWMGSRAVDPNTWGLQRRHGANSMGAAKLKNTVQRRRRHMLPRIDNGNERPSSVRPRFALALLATFISASCANVASPSPSEASAPSAPANGPLWSTDGGGFSPAAGSVNSDVACQSVWLSLQRDRAKGPPPAPRLIGQASPCRPTSLYIGYLRSTLFIEGLDANGARLFVATGDNPMHQDVEAPPPRGGQMRWFSVDNGATQVSTSIRAPITPALTRMRWYDVDENNQPRLIGETSWVNAPAP